MIRFICEYRVPPFWCGVFFTTCAIAGYVAGGFHG
jgi:hypothetical protein